MKQLTVIFALCWLSYGDKGSYMTVVELVKETPCGKHWVFATDGSLDPDRPADRKRTLHVIDKRACKLLSDAAAIPGEVK
jgi:hypothetical protein